MTQHSIPHPSNDLDPSLEALLRASDPATAEHIQGMEHSRANTSGVPAGGYVPSISQQAIPLTRPAHGDTKLAGSSAQRPASTTGRHWGVFLAVAASTAVVAGVAVFGLWSSNARPAPGPAVPPPVPATTAPETAPSYFNPLDAKIKHAFSRKGGESLVGRLRATLNSDPQELRATGWVFELYTKSGSTPTADLTDEGRQDDKILIESDWVPIDLGGRDTSRLGSKPETGDLVIVYFTNLRDGILEPEPGPFGILLSDPRQLARGSVENATSTMTLDGEHLDATAADLGVPYFVQQAAFTMKCDFSGVPRQTPSTARAMSFHSQTDGDAQSCIAFTSDQGDKILSFPAGSTASVDLNGDLTTFGDGPVLYAPLRIKPSIKAGQSYDTAGFSLDTTNQRPASLKVWPTGKTGNCGGYTGEIVKFAGPR